MKHQTIYKELGISYKNYTKLRNKYRFFAYITDLLTLDYVLNVDNVLANQLLDDLKEILQNKAVLRGLDVALFGSLSCFSLDNLHIIRSLAEATDRYQSHKWQYGNSDIGHTGIGDKNVINI